MTNGVPGSLRGFQSTSGPPPLSPHSNGTPPNAAPQVTAEHKKPMALMTWCLKWVTADSILDPFMGSGTTGVAALKAGKKFSGIEVEPRYFDIACERITNAQRQERLFA